MPRPAMDAEAVAATRAALLDTAQKLYESGGPDAMSFRALAEAYGCSNTMPYSYFSSKAAIVDALRIRAYEWVREVLSEVARRAAGPEDALHALATAYVHAAAERPRMYQLLYTDAGAMAETEPELVEAKLAAIAVCRQVIEAHAKEAGLTLRADPETTAHLFWAAAHGLVSLDAGGFLVVGRTVDALLPVLFTTLAAGMVTEAS